MHTVENPGEAGRDRSNFWQYYQGVSPIFDFIAFL
jgi:hypothetical protein